MFKRLMQINRDVFEWYFNHKETKLCTFIMFCAWFALLFKIFVDLTN